MIKVPDNDKQHRRYQNTPLLDDSFDPTRDDWSRHGNESGRHNGDGLGYRDEADDNSPSWFEDDDGDEVDGEEPRS